MPTSDDDQQLRDLVDELIGLDAARADVDRRVDTRKYKLWHYRHDQAITVAELTRRIEAELRARGLDDERIRALKVSHDTIRIDTQGRPPREPDQGASPQ